MGEIKEEVSSLEQAIMKTLEEVMDPEIPMLSLVDLGIISQIEIKDDAFITIYMTPTFSGCPAIHVMQKNIKDKVTELFPDHVTEVKVDFTRQWTSNMITDKGREALKNFELTPPKKYTGELDIATMSEAACPHCGSANTTMKSMFGPTLCRSIHFCFDCRQSFQQFKPI
jgi:ring-1,2-phenylacetyl-CoA epoxidase subunit PaaD